MKYTRMREYLARSNRDMRARDMRNPYGSRGGYVVSDKRYNDMAYDREHYMPENDRMYPMPDYEENSRNNQYDRQYGGDYDYYPVRRSGYFDYNTYGYDMARNRDMMRRDRAENDYRLTNSELRKWEKNLDNVDGTKGAKFSVDQIRQVAQNQGIKFDEFTPELLTTITNVMYSDYGSVIKGDITTYVRMAKAFLCDEDFDGTPEEKAYLYYYTIVNKEDE